MYDCFFLNIYKILIYISIYDVYQGDIVMSKGIFVRMDEDMIKKIDRLAKKLKRTRSDIIRDAVKALLMREEMMTDKMRGLVKIKLKDIENLAFELKGL